MKKMFCLFLAMVASVFGYAADSLVVRYGAAHLNGVEKGIMGVLITPSGETLYTDPLGPYEQYNMVIESPEVGVYQAYFEVLAIRSSRSCPLLGGINALLCSNPGKPLIFSPKSAHIQAIPPGTLIQVGSVSNPVATFELTELDIVN